jgi:flagellar hook-length control protein FliK
MRAARRVHRTPTRSRRRQIASVVVENADDSTSAKPLRPPETAPGSFTVAANAGGQDEALEANVPVRTTVQSLGDTTIRAVRYLTSRGEERLIVRIVPESLGELHIFVRSNEGGIEVRLASVHAAVRDALEQQLHALREAFARDGVDVARVSVSSSPQWDVSHNGQAARYGPYANSGARHGPPPGPAYRNGPAGLVERREGAHHGLLDVFA